MGALKGNETKFINKSLISIKVVTFFIVSGLTALHVLHSTLPLVLGLNFDEYRTVNIIAPFVSILGPLIGGPLVDKLAARNPAAFGRNLRVLTSVLLIIAALIYCLLFAVPKVQREEARRPLVSFGCDKEGAVIFQERCSEEATCRHWKGVSGYVKLANCSYACQNHTEFEDLYNYWVKGSPAPTTEYSSESAGDYDYGSDVAQDTTASFRVRRAGIDTATASIEDTQEQISSEVFTPARKTKRHIPEKVYVEPPHLCMKSRNSHNEDFIEKCHVYTDDTPSITVSTILRAATNIENDTHSAEWCNYPLDGFQCIVPEMQAEYMRAIKNERCKPMVICQVIDPYDSTGSVLENSQCIKVVGDLDTTLNGYFAIRIVGDIFPLAVLTLLNTAIVIAVRETSEGRGEVCRQYIWGAIGYVILFSPLDVLYFSDNIDIQQTATLIALVLVIVCFLLAAIVLLISSGMPISPPEWWWHTKTGVLVYPMSAIRKYAPEMIALTLIAIILGTFWGSIHNYLKWTFSDCYAITFTSIVLICALFLNVDKFIEFCGHSNILIGGFAIYIIRFTALAGDQDQINWLTVVMEIIEPLVIGLLWITVILYMRHIIPRKFTATGQAISVIAFFSLGKGFGALIGLLTDAKHPETTHRYIYEILAIVACFIAIIYFIIYNLILAPRFTAKPQSHPPTIINGAQTTNGGTSNGGTNAPTQTNGQSNSSYTPLRVYHNERGKKGQYRF